jgi:hypothetical protein
MTYEKENRIMAKDFVCSTCRYVKCRCQNDPLMAAEIRLAHASDEWMDAQYAFELAKQNYHYAFDEVKALRAQKRAIQK